MLNIHEAYKRAGIATARPYQENAWRSIIAGRNTLISAGTGSGKTEAALLPASETGRRILILYPTKALLQDQHERVRSLVVSKSIAVDTGDEDDHHFYRADVILTSLDKFLYRFFGYGKKRWSYIYPYRIAFANDRAPILILDEAHAYEDVAFSHLWFLLKKLTYERRVQTVLLSATLPGPLIEALEDLCFKHFPRGRDEGRFFELIEDHENRGGALVYGGVVGTSDLVGRSLELFDQGKRVIIVLGRVVPATTTESSGGLALQQLWSEFVDRVGRRGEAATPPASLPSPSGDTLEGNILAYHGHQMPTYRRQVLDRLKALDESWKPDSRATVRRQPFLLLTTSAMEVGVDISSDVMITDLCEPDSFIQRIGRCARRAGEAGAVYLTSPAGGRIGPRGSSLWGFLQQLSPGRVVDSNIKEDMKKLISFPNLKGVPLRLEYLQDLSLHRYVYDFIEENRELWEKGVLITRDWEPSIIFVRSEKRERGDYIGGIKAREFWRGEEIKEKLLLPVSGAADVAPFCAWAFECYNEGNQYAQRIPIGGSSGRTLLEALRLAGLSPQAQGQNQHNRIRAIYGLDLPLILVLPSVPDIWQKVFPTEETGLVYRNLPTNEWGAKSEADRARWPGYTRSPNAPHLRTFGRILRKDSGETELPVYWFEPVEESQ